MGMDAKLVSLEPFNVLGVESRIDPMNTDYPKLWQTTFDPHHEQVRSLSAKEGHYGLYFASPVPERVDFIAGMAVGPLDSVPAGLVVRTVPAGLYAEFQCDMASIAQTWHAIYGTWFPKTPDYTHDDSRPCFEYFPPGVDEGQAPVTISVAVKAT